MTEWYRRVQAQRRASEIRMMESCLITIYQLLDSEDRKCLAPAFRLLAELNDKVAEDLPVAAVDPDLLKQLELDVSSP